MALTGFANVQVVTTISRGRVVWHNGKLDVQPGMGRFVPLPPGGHLFEGLDTGSGAMAPWMLDLQKLYGTRKDAHESEQASAAKVLKEEL